MAAITNFTGSIPLNYETYLGPLFFEPYAVDLAQRIEGSNFQSVLELACGTGRVTKHLVNKLSAEGRLQAIDLNAGMLQIAKEQLQDNRIHWSVADAHELPFESKEFDLAVCQFGVMFFADKPKVFAEVFRVLRPGGRFVFNTWDALQYNALALLTEQAMQDVFPKDSPIFFMKGPHSFCDPAQIRQLLTEAGFSTVSIDKVSKTSIAASADDAVKGVLDGTPVSPFLAERVEVAKQVRQRLKDLLITHYGETNLALPMQAFVCEALKP